MYSRQQIVSPGVGIKCPLCQYEWTYRGRFVIYASCPSCRRNIRIPENKIKLQSDAKVGGPSQTVAAEVAQTSSSDKETAQP